MAGGSLHKERATDQQCDHCGKWFGARGIHAHQENCDGENDDEDDEHVFDPAPETETDQTQTMTETDTETATDTDRPDDLECPECGGTEDIVSSERAVRLFREADELTGSRLDALLSYDFYHNDADCMAVFDA